MRNGPAVATALVSLAVIVAAGCARCGGAGGPPPERFLATDTPLAVVVPSLRSAQEEVAPLVRTALGFPAAADLAAALEAVRAQLGFDPLDPGALANAGVDPSRGAALALAPGAPPILVLPAGDARALEALVARLARDRLGAARRDRVTVAGAAVSTFRPREGAPPALSLLVAEGSALLAAGADAPARLAAAAARPAQESLATSAAFAKARAALGPGAVALAYAPPGSPAPGTPLARDGAALGLTSSATRLALRAALLLPPEREQAWRAVLASGGPGDAGAAALARLPADAFLVARFSGDPAPLLRRLLPRAGPAARAALDRAGVDPERDLDALLAPGAAAALSLAPTFEVAAVSREAELRERDPFRLVHLSAELEVKDAERAARALERLARAAPEIGLAVVPHAVAGLPGWRLSRGPTELRVALDGRRLLLAGGPGRLEALVGRASAEGYRPPTDGARAALGGPAGAVLDLGQLVASFRALPPTAYGTGPDAFVMRSLAERVVDPAARLLAASVRVELAAEAALVELVVEARPEASRTAGTAP